MLTQKTLDKGLPGFKLADENGICIINNPAGDKAGFINHRNGSIMILGTAENYQLIANALQPYGDVEITHEIPPGPKSRGRAQGFGIAAGIVESLRGGWGKEDLRTSVTYNYNEKQVFIETTDHKVAQHYYLKYQSEPSAIFNGRPQKVLQITLPWEFCLKADEIA
ncbi:MAG: hypothetical protein WEA58_11460 [Balneolaceae bacterium]